MEVENFDVVVVGAGIAGCIAASLYAREGYTVAILEKKTDKGAYKRVCTHYIQPCATPVIQDMGLEARLREAGALPNNPSIWTADGWITPDVNRSSDTPNYGFNIERRTLDPVLRDYASEHGVTFFYGHAVRELIRDGRGNVTGLKASVGDGSWKEFRSSLVVGADGRNSGIAKLIEAPTRVFPNERFAIFAYYDGVKLKSGENSQFWFFGDKSIFAYPLCNDAVLLCIFLPLADKDKWQGDVDEKFLEEYRSLDKAPDFSAARRSTDFHRMMDMTNCYRKPSGKGVALVGDAALQSDPMSGIGCGWAIQSSYWLFQETRLYVRHPVMRNVGIARYAKTHKRRLLPHNKFIVQSSLARDHGFLEVLLFKAGARNQRVADLIGDFVGRKIDVSDFLSPGNIVRYIAAAASPARKTEAA